MERVTALSDDGFRVWSHYDVLGMPTTILLEPSGTVAHTFDSRFDAAEILARL